MSHADMTAPPRRALVTGANGFMGTYMTDLLAGEGVAVLATDVGPSSTYQGKPNAAGFDYCQCDLRDWKGVQALASRENPDYVFHIAGLFDYGAPKELLYEVNVNGSKNLMLALATRGNLPKRFVTWGAAGIYDFAKESPAKETSPVNPQGGYLTSKFEAELSMFTLGAKVGIPVTSLRPGGVYGPRSKYGVATSIFIAARGGMGPFYFGPGNTRAGMVHAEDVCRAAWFVANDPRAAGEIYNVNDSSAYRTSELMRVAAVRLGFPLIPGNFPLAIMKFFVGNLGKKAAKKNRVSMLNEEMTALVAYDALLDPSKLNELGWTPKWPDSIEGLIATIDQYEREGRL